MMEKVQHELPIAFRVLGALISYLDGACADRSRMVGYVSVDIGCVVYVPSYKSSNFRRIFVLPTGVIHHSSPSLHTATRSK